MNVKKGTVVVLVALVCSSALFAGGQGEEAQGETVHVVNISYENHPGEPTDLAAQEWERVAEEMAGGALDIRLFPSSQLGSKKDVTEQIILGSNVIAITDAGFLMDYVADIGILYAPFLAESYDDYFRVIDSPWFAEQVEALRPFGIEVVTAKWIYGDRHLLTNRPIRTPSDMAGLKVRTPNMDILMRTIDYMGGTATPMPWSETYLAISQGVIDGAENPFPVLWSSKLYEQAEYLTVTGHVKNVSIWIGSSSFFDSLPVEVADAIKAGAAAASEYTNAQVVDAEAEAIRNFEAAGIEIIRPDLAPFREAVAPIYGELWSDELYETIRSYMN